MFTILDNSKMIHLPHVLQVIWNLRFQTIYRLRCLVVYRSLRWLFYNLTRNMYSWFKYHLCIKFKELHVLLHRIHKSEIFLEAHIKINILLWNFSLTLIVYFFFSVRTSCKRVVYFFNGANVF